MCVCVCVCVFKYIYIYVCVCICMCVYVYMYVYLCIYIYIYGAMELSRGNECRDTSMSRVKMSHSNNNVARHNVAKY